MTAFKRLLDRLKRRQKKSHPMHAVVFGFALMAVLGALLLSLPVSSASGERTPLLTAIFTSVSSVCVTGLTVVETASYWSGFGQAVILLLIQTGGLGYMTLVSMFIFLSGRRLGLRERLIMMQSLNLNETDGLARLIRHVLIGTFSFEAAGAAILASRFIPVYGTGRGIWFGVFHSVSAFCNAGFDLIGTQGAAYGFEVFSGDPIVLITLALLLILGGLGFFIWEDVLRRRRFNRLHLHSKLALSATAALLVAGTLLFLILEAGGGSMAGMSFGEKLLNAFFQSATTRTAGFNAVKQGLLSDNSKLISIILMFVGGGGGSTAGGIKTVTVAVLCLTAAANLRGRRDAVAFGRRIEARQTVNAVSLTFAAFALAFISGMVISAAEGLPVIDTLFESFSACGTVGLSTGITGALGVFSQWVLIVCMFLGRVGVMTVSVVLMTRRQIPAEAVYPTEQLMIG